MKRSLAILLAVCMIFVLCACGAQETAPVSESVAEESVSAEETSSVDLQILMEEDDSMINTYCWLSIPMPISWMPTEMQFPTWN